VVGTSGRKDLSFIFQLNLAGLTYPVGMSRSGDSRTFTNLNTKECDGWKIVALLVSIAAGILVAFYALMRNALGFPELAISIVFGLAVYAISLGVIPGPSPWTCLKTLS
jgi:hypothetical protein